MGMSQHAVEVNEGQRFKFGENWAKFLETLNEDRIQEAEKSLQAMLETRDLKGKRFLDIGCGSGLFSLAARRLGASVHSFDFDPRSVASTGELKRQYFPYDDSWKVEEGSVLNEEYMRSLRTFDIVYSWGVLHHTGNMRKALKTAGHAVGENGSLFIAIYNDQGVQSLLWRKVKKAYCSLPQGLKFMVLWPAFVRIWGPRSLIDLLRGKPFHTWMKYKKNRGMSPWRDVVDWVGGYPFEVAKPEEIFDFFRPFGFTLNRLKTCGKGYGCNEFVFRRHSIS